MRTLLLSAIVALAASSPIARHAPAPVAAPVAPCTTATKVCEQWLVYGNGPARSMVYSTYSLDKPNPAITHALIMVHGANRNADHYFETATSAAFLAGMLNNTIVIAPRFAAARDTVAPNEVLWPERGDTWRAGGMSPNNPTLSSFDFVDDLIRKLADKNVFPNLTHIVVTGHSAGGQFTTRYEMANKVDGTLRGVTITYVVANPSSYAWPSAVRPLPTGDADPAHAVEEPLGKMGEKVHTDFTYGPFDSTSSPRLRNYNHWPMGLADRTGYTASMSDEQLKKQLAERPTTYLLGQVDVLPLGGFDSSPNAMAQGPTRRARGEAFVKFITDSLGARPTTIIVSECGHNDRCIFTTNDVFPAIFPK